jgi:hypothetical protein
MNISRVRQHNTPRGILRLAGHSCRTGLMASSTGIAPSDNRRRLPGARRLADDDAALSYTDGGRECFSRSRRHGPETSTGSPKYVVVLVRRVEPVTGQSTRADESLSLCRGR